MTGPHRFGKGERVQVRFESGIIRDGYVKRAFSSGNYTVILDKPLSSADSNRQTHCQPDEVFPPSQEELFGPGS